MASRLFITGGSGMVGRHIQAHPTAADWEILAPTSQELDLRNSTQVANYIAEKQPDLVVHCAGKVGGIRRAQGQDRGDASIWHEQGGNRRGNGV